MAQVAFQHITPTSLSWDNSSTSEKYLRQVEKVHRLSAVKSNNHVEIKLPELPDGSDVEELYAENVYAKLFRVASRDLENNNPPIAYPEYVPQDNTLGEVGRYHLREADFWTCGFFPGTLYSLLERATHFPSSIPDTISLTSFKSELNSLCRAWSEPLHAMATRTDTHDIGFIIEPALRLDYELNGNTRSLQSIITAADSLATRYVSKAKAIRSWDLINKKDVQIISMEENFIIIIDSLCNLDLLYYASKQSGDERLALIATEHAKTLLTTHLRPESVISTAKDGYSGQLYSTCHVANLDPRTGTIKARMTAQGYADSTTWSRGQSWAILGYAQTYTWTQDKTFLEAAMGCAEYFLYRLEKQQDIDRSYKVPLWDFDAPIVDSNPVWDSSAGVIAANGMLLISQALAKLSQVSLSRRFKSAALSLVEDILKYSLAEEKAKFGSSTNERLHVQDVKNGQSFDSILRNSTANNNTGARKRYSNTGLVYADYYLVQFGNRLLQMDLVAEREVSKQ